MTGEKENGSKRALGFQHEEEAVRYLKDQGYPEPPCIISPDTDMGQRHPAALMWWG